MILYYLIHSLHIFSSLVVISSGIEIDDMGGYGLSKWIGGGRIVELQMYV